VKENAPKFGKKLRWTARQRTNQKKISHQENPNGKLNKALTKGEKIWGNIRGIPSLEHEDQKHKLDVLGKTGRGKSLYRVSPTVKNGGYSRKKI